MVNDAPLAPQPTLKNGSVVFPSDRYFISLWSIDDIHLRGMLMMTKGLSMNEAESC